MCTVACALLCKELCTQNLVPGLFTCYAGVILPTGDFSSPVADINSCTHGARGGGGGGQAVCPPRLPSAPTSLRAAMPGLGPPLDGLGLVGGRTQPVPSPLGPGGGARGGAGGGP